MGSGAVTDNPLYQQRPAGTICYACPGMTFSRKNNDLGPRFVEIDEEISGQRLDNFLLRELKGIPRSHVYRIVRSGEVRINKGRCRPNTRLQAGDVVRIPPVRGQREVSLAGAQGYGWLLDHILYEDEHLLALNKPSGLAVHGGSGLGFGIVEGLRQLRPDIKSLELVHRLDKDTSGVLLLAKRRAALRALHESLRTGKAIKHYTALVMGELEGKTADIQAPLRKTERGGERIVRVDPEGKEARSYVTMKQRFAPSDALPTGATLVDVRLFTGRTHQARVHLAHLGHPIAGDPKYGNTGFNRILKSLGLKRLFLHASWLQFPHPDTKSNTRIDAPLADDLAALLARLEP